MVSIIYIYLISSPVKSVEDPVLGHPKEADGLPAKYILLGLVGDVLASYGH